MRRALAVSCFINMNVNEPPKDHTHTDSDYADGSDDDSRTRANLLRLLFMCVMAMIFGIGVTVAGIVVVMQFLWVLFTGEPKKEFRSIGRQLGDYAREIALYMTFNTEERPFPFDRDWPSGSKDSGSDD